MELEKIKQLEENFKFEEAMAEYEKIKAKLNFEDLKRYGELLFEYQNYKKAQDIFKKLLEKEPENEIFIDRLAYINSELDENNSAKVLYNKIEKKEKVKEMEEKEIIKKPTAEILQLILNRFSGREDTFALQWSNEDGSGYYLKRRSIKEKDIRAHLKGKKTIGIYQLKQDNTLIFAAYDIDVRKEYLDEKMEVKEYQKELVKLLVDNLKSYGIDSLIEDSGNKGYHIWIFFKSRVQSYKVKQILESVLSEVEVMEKIGVEIFPKQIDLKGGLGNLIKIPFGIHKKTGRRCILVDKNFEKINNQFEKLKKIKQIDPEDLENLYFTVKKDVKISNKNKVSNQNNIKKEIRKDITKRKEINKDIPFLVKSCNILKQINKKIKLEGHLIEKEEYLLAMILLWDEQGTKYLKEELKRTVDFSEKKLEKYKANIQSYPLNCRKIKDFIIKEGLGLDISKCNCIFENNYRCPYSYIYDVMAILSKKINADKIIEEIFEKKIYKNKIQNEIDELKLILMKKLENDNEYDGVARLKKVDNRLEIII